MRNPGLGNPTIRKLRSYSVNIPSIKEVIWEPLYDFQTYPAAGQNSFTFFQNQIGIGGNTIADTNIESSGQIPKGKNFLVTGIEVNLYPAVDGIGIGNQSLDFLNDVYSFYTARAYLTFRVGSKDYIQISPLIKCPPAQRLETYVHQDQGLAGNTGTSYATPTGKMLDIVDVRLTSNQNFDVRIQFDDLTPLSDDARIGCTLRGYSFRNAQ